MISRFIVRSLAGAMVLAWSGVANAACYGPDQQLPAETVSNFLANPSQLLGQFPNGGAQLISQVRDLVASNPAALPALMGLLANASKDQQSAIGSGLGQAARICASRDQAFATQIQEAVAASGNKDISDAYAAVTLNVPIGGLAAGGGGGGGGTGLGGATGGTSGATVGTPGSALGGSSATNAFSAQASGALSGIGASGTGTTGTGTTSTTAATSVSQF